MAATPTHCLEMSIFTAQTKIEKQDHKAWKSSTCIVPTGQSHLGRLTKQILDSGKNIKGKYEQHLNMKAEKDVMGNHPVAIEMQFS